MARIRIFHASVNPECYDLNKLSQMTFDEAVEFFEHDETCACNTGILEVNDVVPSETKIHAEGVTDGYSPDTMLNWVKVDCCY